MLAVIDTNVIVSAFLSKHADTSTVKILQYVFVSQITPVISLDIYKEYEEVLNRSKFSFPKQEVAILLNSLLSNSKIIFPIEQENILIDKKDKPFLDACFSVDEKCYLITGNKKHFPIYEEIVSPAEMVEMLQKKITDEEK